MDWFCNTEKAKEHKRTCTKNSWECGKCIWIDESSSAMSKYGTFVEEHPKKEKIIKTDSNTTKWDNLAKNVVNKDYSDCDHPLLPEIIRVFKKK
jgi:hypothetical protein